MLADAWFPAPWPRLAELAPAPTIDLTVHFRTALPLPDSLLLGRFTSSLVRDGFFDEDGELWTPDGTLVAQSRQLGLLLGPPRPRSARPSLGARCPPPPEHSDPCATASSGCCSRRPRCR